MPSWFFENFDNVDIRTVMETFSTITGKNILVGDEVEGVVKVKVIQENWDEVLAAILEIKDIGLTLNQNTNIVRNCTNIWQILWE